jgi:aminoglycoside phosphotransferase (APT) family kinase protein
VSGPLVTPFQQKVLAPSNEQLRALLSCSLDRTTRVVDMERAPCLYGSSWWLEEITLHLDDNSRIMLLFKNLGREAKGSGACRVKPAFVTDPTREPWVYRTLLPEAAPGPPKLWATVNDFAAGRHWLFLERVNGAPLSQVGDRDVWCPAARWLGHFHATAPAPRARRDPLLRHDQEYHRRWLLRALSAAQKEAQRWPLARDVAREKLARLRGVATVHERATEEALATGRSLIHGEFYPSNVLVGESGASPAVHPVDWEMAALGPPLLDLAALMSGRWGPDDRIAMTRAYREAAREAGAHCLGLDEFMRGVAACRLLLAVQWLGWAAGWSAPADHQNNWLEEAERCAKELRG